MHANVVKRCDTFIQGLVASLTLALFLMLSLGTPLCAQANEDPLAAASVLTVQAGDSIDSAMPIALNEQTSGAITKSSDYDWYKITITSPGRLRLVFGGDYKRFGSWRVRLHNSANELIWDDYYAANNLEDKTLCTTGLPIGSYFLEVRSSGVLDLNYHLTPDFMSSMAWETEFNDRIVDADPMPLGSKVYGNIQTGADKDWFKLSITSPGRLRLSFGGDYKKSGWWRVWLYNSANEMIWTDTHSADNTIDKVICTTGLPAGSFYVRVDNASSAIGLNYHFTPIFTPSSAWETELNDKIVDADPMPLGSTVYGNLQIGPDEDWYKLSVASPGVLQLTFGGDYAKSGRWTLHVYDSSSKKLWDSGYNASNTVDKSIVTTDVDVGTYYVRVYSSSTTGLTYHFVPRVVESLQDATVSGLKTLTYAGAASLPKPNPTVKLGTKTLKLGVDYTLSYTYNAGTDNGKYVGKASVMVTGKGNYTGTKSASFKIITVADGTTVGAKLNEKTVSAIAKVKYGAGKVEQANSKTMTTFAKPREKTMIVNWKAVAGATNYLVGYKRSTTKTWSYVATGGKTTYTFPGMVEGNLMEFRVAVYDGTRFARSEWTQINCRFYREMVSLKATAGKSKIDVKWGKVKAATGYQVLIGTKGDLSDAKVVTVQGGSTVKTTITKFNGKALKAGKTYYIKMRAIKTATNINGKRNTYIGIQTLRRTCKVK